MMATIHDACRADGRDTLLAVRVQPGARHEGPGEIRALPADRGHATPAAIVWYIRARAVEGQANAALVRSVADHVDVPRSAVEIIRGGPGRAKVLRIRGRPVSVIVAALSKNGRLA
jgi:uncharacterized protein YggU (UPF0235/DUF167 family)